MIDCAFLALDFYRVKMNINEEEALVSKADKSRGKSMLG
jgi:hypothetical protein